MRYASGIIACLLAGCTAQGVSPGQAMGDLNKRFDGHPADDFFLSYGQPVGAYTQEGSGRSYRWVSLEPVSEPSAIPSFKAGRTPGSSGIVNTYTSPTLQYCDLRIHTGPGGIINRIDITGDSQGKWSNSRCAEIFAPVP